MIGRNNPFNIRSTKRDKWKGQIGSTRGFCNFISMDYGIRVAAYLLMISYRKQGIFTIREIINRFAPAVENDVYQYISNVCEWTGLRSDQHLVSISQYVSVLAAMSRQEGNIVSHSLIWDVVVFKFHICIYGS